MRKPLAMVLLAASTVIAAAAAARSISPHRPPPIPVTRGMIDSVAISTDGRAALSRDSEGNLQFWPSLDGKVEPVAVDVQSPDKMALAPRGAGFTLAIVDTAGGGHVLRAGSAGEPRETATISPTDPVRLLVPIPGEGRVLAIGEDSTIRLYGETGKPLARIEERDFRPTGLCVASDGKSALVVIEDESIQRVTIGKKKLALEGEAVRLPAAAGASRMSGACSPAAHRYAFLRTTALNTGEIELVVVGLDGEEVATQKIQPEFGVSSLGFIGDETLFLWAPSSSVSSWKYDLTKKELLPRAGRPDPMISNSNEVAAGGRRIGSDGAWLFVQDIDAREQRFLGYQDFTPFMTAMSPGGVAAFADGMGNVLVEDVPGQGRGFIAARPNTAGLAGIYFVDDDHVLLADAAGTMRLVAWRSGKSVDRVWSGFFGGEGQFESSTGLFRVTNGGGQTYLWEVNEKGFTGPYVLADGGLYGGLLAADKGSQPAVWTLDGANVRREYTLAELRGDLSLEEMTSRGKQPDVDAELPFVTDARGRKYFVRADDNGIAIIEIVAAGGKSQKLMTDFADVTQIIPAADGSMVAVVDGAGALAAFRPGERRALWTYSDRAGIGAPVWSPDGTWLAMVGTGAVVLDGGTGEVAYRRRVLAFEKRQVLEFPMMNEFFGRGEPGIIDF